MAARTEPSLEGFLPRRGDGLLLSASDIETYRTCPLKYKFARVFRIPQEPTINQRFGIVVHQVLERFHAGGGGSIDALMQLFEASWRRSGFGDHQLSGPSRAISDGTRSVRTTRASISTPTMSSLNVRSFIKKWSAPSCRACSATDCAPRFSTRPPGRRWRLPAC